MDLFPVQQLVTEGVEVLLTSATTGQNVVNLLNWLVVRRDGGEDAPQCCFPWRKPARVANMSS